MEVKEKSKKREAVKTAAIVFLIILLLLTFFSNTIMNRSLPEVATQSISSGTINARIRGSGTVLANESYEVVINQTREVRSVCVGVGDFVSQGDLLFVLGDMESEELKNAQEQLDNAQMQYQQKLLTLSREYASEDRTIQVLREDLEKATAQRDSNKVTDTEISAVKGELTQAKNQLTQIDLFLEEIAAQMGDNGAYADAQAEVNKWKGQMESAQQLVTQYTNELNALNSGGSVGTNWTLKNAEASLAAAKNTLTSDWAAYGNYYAQLLNAANGGALTPTVADLGKAEYQIAISTWLTQESLKGNGEQDANYATYKKAFETLMADHSAVGAAQQTVDKLLEDQTAAAGDAAAQKAAVQTKLNQASYEYSVAYQQLQQANLVLAQAESSNTAMNQQKKNYEASRRQQSALVDRLSESVTELESKKVLYDQAVDLVAEKERAIADALNGKNIDKQLNDLDLQNLQTQIDKAQALVDKYTADTIGTEVTANVSGRISAIHVSAGKETAAGTAMATIDVVDRGYLIKIPVTKEQSMQVRAGDTAKISNYYWGNDLEAVLESIIADPDKPGQGKLLVFRITGDVDTGTNLTLSIGQRSANYDTVIPKSALREDTNGYFVLVITVKSSPLSNRYIATRVNVQVLAEDDTSAAVSGLSAGDFVITTSSKPVEAGSQVRMVENS